MDAIEFDYNAQGIVALAKRPCQRTRGGVRSRQGGVRPKTSSTGAHAELLLLLLLHLGVHLQVLGLQRGLVQRLLLREHREGRGLLGRGRRTAELLHTRPTGINPLPPVH